jgi:1-pyrroline-5-carboxylate dehydrogenase
VIAKYSQHKLLLFKAGVPDGVINVVLEMPNDYCYRSLPSRDFAGLHFTGSTHVFKDITDAKLELTFTTYKTYPRIVGETEKRFYYHSL